LTRANLSAARLHQCVVSALTKFKEACLDRVTGIPAGLQLQCSQAGFFDSCREPGVHLRRHALPEQHIKANGYLRAVCERHQDINLS